jgi:hypothetical protein
VHPLDPPVISRGAQRQTTWQTSVSEGRNWARKLPLNLACDSDFHVNRGDRLHAANLRPGTDGFTSRPKGGILWIFLPEKFRPGSNPRSWVPEASMLTTRPPKPLRWIYLTWNNIYQSFYSNLPIGSNLVLGPIVFLSLSLSLSLSLTHTHTHTQMQHKLSTASRDTGLIKH